MARFLGDNAGSNDTASDNPHDGRTELERLIDLLDSISFGSSDVVEDSEEEIFFAFDEWEIVVW
jgi:hypothetical protein